MKAADWRPYAQRWMRDALACACGAVKVARGPVPAGWERRFLERVGRTEVRCPGCAEAARIAPRVTLRVEAPSPFDPGDVVYMVGSIG